MKSLFHYRPQKGDVWTVRRPNKRAITKTVARVSRTWYSLPWTLETGYRNLRIPTVHWVRTNKGRYSQIRVKWLLKYGTLISRGLEIDYNRHSGRAAKERKHDRGVRLGRSKVHRARSRRRLPAGD